MEQKIEVDQEILMFINNTLRAFAHDMDPSAFLTDQQKEWTKILQACQPSVKIYVNDKYQDQIKPVEFAKLTNPRDGLKKFFDESQVYPDTIMTASEIDTLANKNFFAPDASQATNRRYTKYRVIFSEVPVLNEDGSIHIIKV